MHNEHYPTLKGRKSCQMLQHRSSWNIQYKVKQTRQKVQTLRVSIAWGTWNSQIPRKSKQGGDYPKQRRIKRSIKSAFGYSVPPLLDEGILKSEQTINKIILQIKGGMLERCLNSKECQLLLQRTQVQFLAPTQNLQVTLPWDSHTLF